MSNIIKDKKSSYSTDLVRSIVINSSHFKAGSKGTFIYNLPSSWSSDGNAGVGLASLTMYNSTFNITSERGNNVISFIWNVGTPVTYTWTIPNGYYSVSDLNYYIQNQCILNNLYCISGTNFVYFLELETNPVRYSIQLNSFPIPTSTNATALGYVKPTSTTWSFPASSTANNPQITITTAFGNLIGFNAGTYPSSLSTSTQSVLSSKTPIISPVSTYIIRCNLINNKFSNPNDIMIQIPLNSSLGSLINYNASDLHYSRISSNTYKQIILTFTDQQFEEIQLNDIDVSINLTIIESE